MIPCFLLLTSLFASSTLSAGLSSSAVVTSASLSGHWIASQNCYRDELNQSDTDYNNCWMDNAGKILVMSSITGDLTDVSRSLGFIERYLSQGAGTTGDYYLPELAVLNSNVIPPSQEGASISISNGIVELTANNFTASHYNQLAIGTSYTGNANLAYIGGDRIWFNNGTLNSAFSSISSSVFSIPNGFSKRSLFDIAPSSYYVYVNATIAQSDPFAQVSIQLEPIGSSPANSVQYIFLQAFNTTSTNPFYSGSMYSLNGSYTESLGYRTSLSASGGGILLGYSNATNVFTSPASQGNVTGQDALAIKFGNNSIYDWEHWAEDLPFSHSWFGPGYIAQQNVSDGSLSKALYSDFYPILHFDYHLANQTAEYIASSPTGVAVSPPVGFGFISYGLALEAASNATLRNFASGYWNYYYSAYNNTTTNYGTPYARSINLLALAGFKLFGCNSRVENFARDFIGNTSGSSIEEYGWGVAALSDLKNCTGSQSDVNLYNSFVNSFGTSSSHFILLDASPSKIDLDPEFTFQFGEAASGLMLGGIPYNDSVVVRAMDAVFQSNASGTLLNQPYSGDLANTETLPAYMLSTWLFQGEMRNQSGFWITSLVNANITSIDYTNETLLIGVDGNNGSLSLLSSSVTKTISGINGNNAYQINSSNSTATTTATTKQPCLLCLTRQWWVVSITALVVVAVSASLALVYRRRVRR